MGLFSWFSRSDGGAVAAPPRPRAEPAPKKEAAAPRTLRSLPQELEALAQRFKAPGEAAYLQLLKSALSPKAKLELPVLPGEAMRIQELITSPDVDVEALAEVIGRDPLMSARFISIANSPMFGGRTAVAEVERAIVRLGLKQASMLAMAIVAQAKMFKVPGEPERAHRVQAHSLASAAAAQRIALRAKLNPAEAFLAGLLHELGRVFLLTAKAELYRSSRGKQAPSAALEAEAERLLHAPFAGLIAERWEFERPLYEALRHYDLPIRAPALTPSIPQDSLQMAYVLAGAERVADHILDPKLQDEGELDAMLSPIGVSIDADLIEVATAGFEALAG